jgi:hypothetical protein
MPTMAYLGRVVTRCSLENKARDADALFAHPLIRLENQEQVFSTRLS